MVVLCVLRRGMRPVDARCGDDAVHGRHCQAAPRDWQSFARRYRTRERHEREWCAQSRQPVCWGEETQRCDERIDGYYRSSPCQSAPDTASRILNIMKTGSSTRALYIRTYRTYIHSSPDTLPQHILTTCYSKIQQLWHNTCAPPRHTYMMMFGQSHDRSWDSSMLPVHVRTYIPVRVQCSYIHHCHIADTYRSIYIYRYAHSEPADESHARRSW